ncbi:hypothetical protein Ddc_24581 [Ditylenchus destructor]|nr:hypothetical protein Ddc_24581 [Ditylenchus destructor]
MLIFTIFAVVLTILPAEVLSEPQDVKIYTDLYYSAEPKGIIKINLDGKTTPYEAIKAALISSKYYKKEEIYDFHKQPKGGKADLIDESTQALPEGKKLHGVKKFTNWVDKQRGKDGAWEGPEIYVSKAVNVQLFKYETKEEQLKDDKGKPITVRLRSPYASGDEIAEKVKEVIEKSQKHKDLSTKSYYLKKDSYLKDKGQNISNWTMYDIKVDTKLYLYVATEVTHEVEYEIKGEQPMKKVQGGDAVPLEEDEFMELLKQLERVTFPSQYIMYQDTGVIAKGKLVMKQFDDKYSEHQMFWEALILDVPAYGYKVNEIEVQMEGKEKPETLYTSTTSIDLFKIQKLTAYIRPRQLLRVTKLLKIFEYQKAPVKDREFLIPASGQPTGSGAPAIGSGQNRLLTAPPTNGQVARRAKRAPAANNQLTVPEVKVAGQVAKVEHGGQLAIPDEVAPETHREDLTIYGLILVGDQNTGALLKERVQNIGGEYGEFWKNVQHLYEPSSFMKWEIKDDDIKSAFHMRNSGIEAFDEEWEDPRFPKRNVSSENGIIHTKSNSERFSYCIDGVTTVIYVHKHKVCVGASVSTTETYKRYITIKGSAGWWERDMTQAEKIAVFGPNGYAKRIMKPTEKDIKALIDIATQNAIQRAMEAQALQQGQGGAGSRALPQSSARPAIMGSTNAVVASPEQGGKSGGGAGSTITKTAGKAAFKAVNAYVQEEGGWGNLLGSLTGT